MINRFLTVSLLAGLVVGLAVAVLQHFVTTPIILAAEVYEKAAEEKAAALHQGLTLAMNGDARLILAHSTGEKAPNAAPGHDHALPEGHEHPADAWEPADGLERTFVTTISTIAMSVGYALLLVAAMALSGERFTMRSGLAWGAAGFAAFGLATAMGLAPELPGSAAAELAARQIWWVGAALATAGGLWLIIKQGGALPVVFGLALIVLPHAIGAPHAHDYGSTAPAELAATFAARSLGVTAAMWLMIGAAVGLIWQRLDQKTA